MNQSNANDMNLKVLIIDDNPAIHADFIKTLTIQEEMLTSSEKELFGDDLDNKEIKLPNFKIDTALQGQLGVQLIEKAYKEGSPYALAFVDIRMPPGWDGIETIKHIWKIDPDIQIVICTAYSDYTWEETINQLGEKENLLILKKPFDVVSVRQLAYALTKKWQLLQDKRNYTAFLEDRIQERTQALAYQATHDPLTDLPNRVILLDRIKQLIEQNIRNKNDFAIIFFDLDRFKLINDSLGHATGDELLKQVTKRVKESLRDSDTFVRFGGDEFVIIATNIQNQKDVEKVANNILQTFSKQFDIDGHKFPIGTSIGISIYNHDAKNLNELLKNADAAMYKSKENGGNQFQFYSEELNQQNLLQLEMENDLHLAIRNNEFVLYYQPQYNIIENKIISLEALLRWNHPKKGLLLPYDFIPLAETIGLIVPIGEWIIKKVCLQNKAWQVQGFPKIPIAVNITSKQLKQPNLVEKVKKILDETQLEPEYLELELTENVAINMIEPTINSLTELKQLGVRIALDDFGTGYSSMSYLKKIPLDRIKIDQSFVQNIALDTADEVIIQTIITMAKQLNLEVLAEGVETQKQIDFLKLKKCDEVQGYYYNQTLSQSQIEEIFKTKSK